MEIIEITEVMKLIGQGSQSFSSIVTNIGILRKFFEQPESANAGEIEVALSTLNKEIAHSNNMNAELTNMLTQLQTQIIELKRHKDELDRYDLYETNSGNIVYKIKETDQKEREPTTYLCQPCTSKNKTMILQGGDYVKQCPECKTVYNFETKPRRSRTRTIRTI